MKKSEAISIIKNMDKTLKFNLCGLSEIGVGLILERKTKYSIIKGNCSWWNEFPKNNTIQNVIFGDPIVVDNVKILYSCSYSKTIPPEYIKDLFNGINFSGWVLFQQVKTKKYGIVIDANVKFELVN